MVTLDQLRSLVDTVVIVMLENRSFDHMLGFLSHEAFDGRADVDGLHQHNDNFDWDNPDPAGNLFAPTATPDGYLPCDVPHSRAEIAAQLSSGAMDGFIKAYFSSQHIDQSPVPMRFCRPEDVPITAALARGYSVCDRWFASVPADTQPNRLMSLCGTTFIDSTSNIKPPSHLLPNQNTLFDWLANKGKKFEMYVDAKPIADVGVPSNLLLMASQWKHILAHGRPLDLLAANWGSASPAPDVVYCEPFFNDFATVLGTHGNCNHPPLPAGYGEDFLRRVYQALTSNPAKWARTVLLVCYDEHGGFFDHVAPPPMAYSPPPGNSWVDPKPMTTLGVRIPGIVVSPLVEAGSRYHGLLDHTSILQLIVDRFGTPADLAFFGEAAVRKNNGVNSLASALTRTTPRSDVLSGLVSPKVSTGSATTPPISSTGMMFRGVMADKPAKQAAGKP
jgi:phospholipase C